MQRHLKARPAPAVSSPTLSVEEEAILIDEASEAGIAADAAAADLDRVAEVADVANDTMLVVDETPEVGQVEQELVNAVGEMAVAGTDESAEDVISMPTGADDKISVEGIASALKSIWDAIVTAIKNMWIGIKHWLTTYFSTLEQNKKHALSLIERLGTMKGYLANEGAMVTSSMTDIYHYTGRSFLDLFNTAGRQEEAFNTYVLEAARAHHESMGLIGAALEYGYQNFDGMNADQAGNFVEKIVPKLQEYAHKLKLEQTKGDVWETKQKMGQMKVVVKGYSDKIADPAQSVETQIAMLCKIRFSVDQDTSFGSNKLVSMKLDVTPDKLLEYTKERLTFIEELLKFKGDQFKSLEAQLDKVQKSCEEMIKRVKEDNKEGSGFAKRMMPLCSAYANWATQPTAKLFSTAARHNKFWLSLFEMATNNFQKA